MELYPWHDQARKALWKRHLDKVLPHALLFTGPPSVGKHALAEWLAQALLCESADHQGLPCNACRSCRLYCVGNHPDAQTLAPDELGKPIRIDAVRLMCANLALTSQYGGYKIAIVSPADALNVYAANSLLKTLEEPPAYTLLILVSGRPGLLPATIRSRCQRLTVAVGDLNVAKNWLQTRTEGDAEILLSVANGSPLLAETLGRETGLAARNVLFEQFRDTVLGRASPVAVAESWKKEPVEALLYWLVGWIADMVRLKLAPRGGRFQNPDILESLASLSNHVALRSLFFYLDQLGRSNQSGATNLNTQLFWEELLINATELTRHA